MEYSNGDIDNSQTPRRSTRGMRTSFTDHDSLQRAKRQETRSDDPTNHSRLTRGRVRSARGRGRISGEDAHGESAFAESDEVRAHPTSSSIEKFAESVVSSKRDVAMSEANEARRIELLKRLNQIERQRTELTRAGGASFGKISIPSHSPTSGASHAAPGRPASKRLRANSSVENRPPFAKRHKLETAIASSSPQPSINFSSRIAGQKSSSPGLSRSRAKVEAPPTPELDLEAARPGSVSGAGISTGVSFASQSRPSINALSPAKDIKQFMAPSTPPASPTSSRATGRVRTPSVLLTKQPGEGSTGLANSKDAPKNNQVSFCLRIVKDMLRLKDAFAFSKPIDQLWPIDQLPGYFEMIHKPMDLTTIREKLENGAYLKSSSNKHASEQIFGSQFDSDGYASDMCLVFDNARTYNRPGDIFYEAAGRLKEKFESKFAQLPSLKEASVISGKKSKKKKRDTSRRENNGFRLNNMSRKSDAKRRKASSSANETLATGTNSSPNASRAKTKKSSAAGSGSNSLAGRNSESAISASSKDLSFMNKDELRERLNSLQRQLALTSTRSPSPSPSPSSGAASYLVQAQAMYHLPMTFEDKVRLSENVGRLPCDKLQKLVALVSKNTASTMEVNNDEEIELDIDHMDNKTLRDMEAFVNHTLNRKRGGAGRVAINVTGEFAHMTKEDLLSEMEHVRGLLNVSRSNGNQGSADEGQQDSDGRQTGSKKQKSFYDDSDSSSESDSSGSGSSGSDSSDDDSDEESESSEGAAKGEERQKLRERNFEHRRQMSHPQPGSGTPHPSPTYSSLQASVHGARSESASPQGDINLHNRNINSARSSLGSSNHAASPRDQGSPASSA